MDVWRHHIQLAGGLDRVSPEIFSTRTCRWAKGGIRMEVTEAFTTLGAVFLGWLLSAVQQWVQSGKAKRRTRANVRRLIALEIHSNGRALHSFWEHIERHKDAWQKGDGEIIRSVLGRLIADAPFPDLSTFIWFSNAALLADAYSRTEIDDLWQTYTEYSRLTNLYQYLVISNGDTKEASGFHKKGDIGAMLAIWAFREKAGDHVETFKATIEKLVRKSHD